MVERTRKSLPEQIIETAKSKPAPKPIVETVSSGCTVLDLALGGGYPWGRIINIVGDKSTGKTLLAIEAIAKARQLYGKRLKWFYDDAESGFGFDTQMMYGFDVMSTNHDNSSYTVEEFGRNLVFQLGYLKKGEKLIYVLDSLDSLTSDAEVKRSEEELKAIEKGKEYEAGTYGLEKPKQLGRLFRLHRNSIAEKDCLLIIISQVRENIGMFFGEKYYRTGGKALDFYASQIIWLAEVEKDFQKKVPVGVTIKARVKKNKVGRPFRECFVNLLFDYGVDDISTSIDYFCDLRNEKGKIEKKIKPIFKAKEFMRAELIKAIEVGENLISTKELIKEVEKKWAGQEEQARVERKQKYE